MSSLSRGLYQCPKCYGPSDGPGWCRRCMSWQQLLPSRVHWLARQSFTGLLAIYHQYTAQDAFAGHRIFTTRDQVITAIRDLEDPQRLAMGASALEEDT